MLYVLLIVLAIIIDSWIPIAVGIALWIFANWEPESAYSKYQRKAARQRRKMRRR